jgi:hypothetical protein
LKATTAGLPTKQEIKWKTDGALAGWNKPKLIQKSRYFKSKEQPLGKQNSSASPLSEPDFFFVSLQLNRLH